MKKYYGFTLVELVFVIVILGILASIAVPKLVATRDDAKISVMANNIQTAKGEIASYFVSKGSFETNASKMSNIINEYEKSGEAINSVSDKTTIFKTDNGGVLEECIKFDWSDNKNLVISHQSGNGDICKGVKSFVKSATFAIKGEGISY